MTNSIKQPNFLIIGAAGRNVGKTEFACELIRKYVDEGVIGVKITTITEGPCPRGRADSCGVCGSLTDGYCLTEETEGNGDKDTMRMLRSGAKQVFWLRVREEQLEVGIEVLLENIPAGAAVVCESNRARTIIEPGVFMVFREAGEEVIKESCRQVIDRADRIVEFNGNGWDFSPDEIEFSEGIWRINK